MMAAGATAIDCLDWADIALQLDREAYALLPKLVAPQVIQALRRQLADRGGMGGVSMAEKGLGHGEFFYDDDALYEFCPSWRASIYRRLVPIANQWNARLSRPYRYPAELQEFLERNRSAGQTCPQSCLIRMAKHGYQALHQRTDGDHVFPVQCVALLSQPGKEFAGGEFIMTEQRPRMQSRPVVLPLQCGDVALIATAQRPVKGSKGDYRVNLRHGIGRVLEGERIGLEISFHNAPCGVQSGASTQV